MQYVIDLLDCRFNELSAQSRRKASKNLYSISLSQLYFTLSRVTVARNYYDLNREPQLTQRTANNQTITAIIAGTT
jgi:hypothetical protein